jgi:class 3 adenylate cyclase/tetratricopeptide (TPR) repeat protein
MTQELPEGTVTVLFSDVVGSTDLTTSRGDEAAQDILRAQRELVRGQVEEHSGHEVKSIGDGFMVAFGSARRAVACAVGIQRALQEHNRVQPLDEQVQVRVGMNTGEVLQEEADLFGEAVNAAARIAGKAKGGQILISETTRGVIGRAKDVELVDRGRFRLKGFPERWRLFEVIWQEEKPAVGPALVERTPFVGREAERAELRRCVEQAANGQGALVVIGGEPGVGKTRLAEEMALEARQRGLLTLVGHCYETEGAPPYIPFVEIVEASARLVPPEALRDALGESAPEVAKLMPELRRTIPDIPSPPELPPEQERRYLFNGMRDFLARGSRVQPMFIVLDDLHWADDSTMLLIQHIVQQLHEMPLLVVGTYRDVELEVARPLARALRELTRQRLVHRLSVRRMPEAEVEAMLRALGGQDPPAVLVHAIYSETEGNPFFVEEVFQHLAEEGRLFDPKGRWRSDLSIDELEVPEGVRLVVGERLERVGEECRKVLTSAAVIGRSFTFELLEALSEIDTDALLDAIDAAERSHTIAVTSRVAEESFAFSHELIRQTLLSGLSSPRRRRLHLRVAEAMEATYADAVEDHATDLAYHLDQAGTFADLQKTCHYMTLAGEQAMAATAFEQALRHYESALSLQPADDRRGRAALLYKRGSALRSVGRWDEALADWQESLAAYEGLGDVEAVGRVSREMGWQLGWANRLEEALEVELRALSVLGEEVNADRCALMAQAGTTQSMGGHRAIGDPMISQALALAEELGDRRLLSDVLASKAYHHFFYAQIREVLDTGLRAADLLRSARDLWLLATVLWVPQWALLNLGRHDEAAEIGEELEPLANRVGHLGALLVTRRVRGFSDMMLTGELGRMEKFAREDLELCRRADMPWISTSYTLLGMAHFWRGQWTEALKDFEEADKLQPPGVYAGCDWAPLCVGQAYAQNRNEALSMLKERRGNLPRPGQINSWGAWEMLRGTVEGLAVLGERDEASGLYSLTLEAIGTEAIISFYGFRLLQTTAGIAAACGSQWEKAEEHYQTALLQAHELPHKIEQPEVRRWYARMLIDRDGPGDRDKARQLLTEAIAMYRRIGMRKHVEMAEAMLGEV